MSAHASRDLIAQRLQLVGDDAGGADLQARQLGMLMEVVEQGGQIGVVIRLHRRLQGRILRQRSARLKHRRRGQYRKEPAHRPHPPINETPDCDARPGLATALNAP